MRGCRGAGFGGVPVEVGGVGEELDASPPRELLCAVSEEDGARRERLGRDEQLVGLALVLARFTKEAVGLFPRLDRALRWWGLGAAASEGRGRDRQEAEERGGEHGEAWGFAHGRS